MQMVQIELEQSEAYVKELQAQDNPTQLRTDNQVRMAPFSHEHQNRLQLTGWHTY